MILYMARTPSTYKNLEALRPYIAQFKEYYYKQMLTEVAQNPNKILSTFNQEYPEVGFFPNPAQYRKWQSLWNVDLDAKRCSMNLTPLYQESVVIVRDDMGKLIAPPPVENIEEGTRSLAGELLNDAMGMLKDDQQRGAELYTDDILIKRKKYVLNVYNFISRNAMAAETLRLKQQANVRENTNFLMDLLRRSAAGKISEEEMALLRNSTKIDESSTVGQDPQQLPCINVA